MPDTRCGKHETFTVCGHEDICYRLFNYTNGQVIYLTNDDLACSTGCLCDSGYSRSPGRKGTCILTKQCDVCEARFCPSDSRAYYKWSYKECRCVAIYAIETGSW